MEHVEHPEDHTEAEPLPFPVGYVDPNEQTGSDDEVAPIPPLPPVKDRDTKWRLWHETNVWNEKFWVAAQPSDIPIPMFKVTGLVVTHSYGFYSHSGIAALQALQLAIYKAEAERHHIEAMQEFHR